MSFPSTPSLFAASSGAPVLIPSPLPPRFPSPSAGVDPDIFYPGESGTTSIFDAPKRKRITTVQQQEVNERLVREAKQAELVAAQEAEWQCDWELRREAELDRIRRKKLERRAGRLRESGGGVGADRAYDSPSPEEVAAAMAQEIEDAEAKRPWTEEEQVRLSPLSLFPFVLCLPH